MEKLRARTLPVAELVLLAIFVISFPLVAYVSTLPVERFRNEITQWGDHQSNTYRQYVDFQERFGDNEFIVISWPGCNLKDKRVAAITGRLESELAGKVERVFDGQTMYWMLRDDVGITDEQAKKRMRGLFLGEEDDSTAVAFRLTKLGRKDRASVVDEVSSILRRSGVDPQNAYFAGLGHNLYTLDKEGLQSPFRMVPQIMLLALMLTIVFVRNFSLALFINALGAYTGCLSFNIIYLADVDMNAILWPLPTLTMLLTVSASLHFLSYFRKSVVDSAPPSGGPASLSRARWITLEAVSLAWKPMLFCAITTALGLASLQFSSSAPVRQFGLYGGMSIVAASALTLLWLPVFLTVARYGEQLQRVLPRVDSKAQRENSNYDAGESPFPFKRFSDGLVGIFFGGRRRDGWQRLAWFTRTFRWPIIVVSSVGLIAMAAGITKIKNGSNVHNFFPKGHRVLNDLAAIENATGPLSSVELLLRFTGPKKSNDRTRIKGLRMLSSRIVEATSAHSCISAATFAPVWKKRPTVMQEIGELAQLRRLKEEAVNSKLLHVVPSSAGQQDNSEETWRVSCRYYDVAGADGDDAEVDLPLLCQRLKSLATDVFLPNDRSTFQGETLEISTTGEFVLFEEIDRQFFSELMKTYLTAFVLISIVVLMVLRMPIALLLALPPNLFPAVMVLGAAGHLGYALDAASLMTASVALGIAVDDTLHLMLWWKQARAAKTADGQPTDADSIEQAMRYSGTAMTQTSLILGLSIVLYAFCGFLPTVRFGLLLCGMMLAALIGDLILLPALLATQEKYPIKA